MSEETPYVINPLLPLLCAAEKERDEFRDSSQHWQLQWDKVRVAAEAAVTELEKIRTERLAVHSLPNEATAVSAARVHLYAVLCASRDAAQTRP